ncbi:MAG: heme-binding beta-barrel domain-containing protein [Candidatus Nanopelagicales bacterium]
MTTTHDIFTEPEGDPDTLASLGPLRTLAGIWQGAKGHDEHPVDEGLEANAFIEHYEAQPIDFQTNGPQLFYGLRYHTHIVKPGEVAMFHEQVGFWLWEPAANTVVMTLAIPRGQVALASGQCEANATTFEVTAMRGLTTYGIVSHPFLDENFTTTDFRMTVTANPDGSWSYDETTRLVLPDRSEPFDHVDRNTLHLVTPPTPNPLALAQ